MDRSKYKALKKELKALIPKDDSLQTSIEAYDDNFYLSFLYSENIYTVEEAMKSVEGTALNMGIKISE